MLPIEDIQGLSGATHEQMQHYELLGHGTGISFPELDVDLYVPALIQGVYGNSRWMTQLGQRGGRADEAVVGKTTRVVEEVLPRKEIGGETARQRGKRRERR